MSMGLLLLLFVIFFFLHPPLSVKNRTVHSNRYASGGLPERTCNVSDTDGYIFGHPLLD
jgi:hypothetical protein